MDTQDGGGSGDTDDRTSGEGSGDTGHDTSTSNGDGDTSTGEGGKSGDTDELEQLRAKVASQEDVISGLKRSNHDLTKDRDKGIKKRKTLEDRVGELETSRKADLEKLAKAERKERVNGTRDAILAGLHPDHQTSKTAKRVIDALQVEGLDFAAEDRGPVVEKAIETLQRDNPEYFERRRQDRAPVLPKSKNGKVKTESPGGITDKDGNRIL